MSDVRIQRSADADVDRSIQKSIIADSQFSNLTNIHFLGLRISDLYIIVDADVDLLKIVNVNPAVITK